MLDVIARIKHAKAQLVERLNREPTTAEVAAAVDMPPKKLTEIMAMSWQSASLDSAIGADEDASTMKDMLQVRWGRGLGKGKRKRCQGNQVVALCHEVARLEHNVGRRF